MSRIALLVGIDDYDAGCPLAGCVADARSMEALLHTHFDDAPNFQCRLLVSADDRISSRVLRQATTELFSKDHVEMAVFYFAGHGSKNRLGGFLATQDATEDEPGVRMEEIIGLANTAPCRERVIILDCCHAGAVADLLATQGNVPLAQGVSILAACGRGEGAREEGGRGVFTRLLCEGLEGGAADAAGRTTVAGLYAYIDEVLTGWDQRPTFLTNVSRLTKLRNAIPSVKLECLRKLTTYFRSETDEFSLSPEFEPQAEPHDAEKERIFGELQQFRAARLLEPVGTDHMYYAAIESRACRLTPLGRFYWRRVKNGQL